MPLAPTKNLNDQAKIPVIGLGTSGLRGEECTRIVYTALEAGYRHIDTAISYLNQQDIGKAIAEFALDRDELFITSKVPRTQLNLDDTIAAFKRSLQELHTDYLDLFLIHWPNKKIPIEETLGALKALKKEGLVKAIGVSNFTINHLKDILNIPKTSDNWVEIDNNQVEFHPSLNQKNLREFCQRNNITVTAYSPLARGQDLEISEIKDIARKYEKTAAQVILNWLLTKGLVVIPRSSSPRHIMENFTAFTWQMEPSDIQRIDSLNRNNRIVNPNFAEFDYQTEDTFKVA